MGGGQTVTCKIMEAFFRIVFVGFPWFSMVFAIFLCFSKFFFVFHFVFAFLIEKSICQSKNRLRGQKQNLQDFIKLRFFDIENLILDASNVLE